MADSTQQGDGADQALALAEAYQDLMVARRLPGWMKALPAGHWDELAHALRQGLESRRQIKAALARVEALEPFLRARLQPALDERFGPGLDIDKVYFRRWYTFYARGKVQYGWTRHPALDSDYYDIPLIEAAQLNFTEAETGPLGQPRKNTLVDEQGERVTVASAVEFAKVCRQLDIGAQYQAHLRVILDAAVSAHFCQLASATLLADACKAHAGQVLSEAELGWVKTLCRDGHLDALGHLPVVAKRLELLGCPLQQVLVLEHVDRGFFFDTSKRLLVHIPGDPHGPWLACDNLRRLAVLLGNRLRQGQYRRFFSRFVLPRDSQAFFTGYYALYGDLAAWATRSLDERLRPCPRRVIEHLADTRIRQIKDDAAVILTPVAQLDREVQKAHQRRLAAEGWTWLSIAGFYIPLLGGVLLAVMAWQLLEEVIQAVEDWRDDATSAALDHVLNVARQVAVIGATAAGVALAGRAWTGARVVDELVPARLEDGREKLWNQDIAAFRSEAPPAEVQPDERGLYEAAGQHWVAMGGHYFALRQTAQGQWQLLPRNGHGPLLHDNGAGAWRLASEHPGQWQGRHYLWRRLGQPFAELSDLQIDRLMQVHQLNEDNLRAWHVHGQPVEVDLLDSLERIRLVQRIADLARDLRAGATVADDSLLAYARHLPGAETASDLQLAALIETRKRMLFQFVHDDGQFTESRAIAALRRQFPRLHQRAANELVRTADPEEQAQLADTGRVPLRLATAARARAARIRRIQLYEALLFDVPQTLDLARISLQLLNRFPATLRWALSEGASEFPLLRMSTGARDADLVYDRGQFSWRDPLTGAQGEPGELFQTMASAYRRDEIATLLRGQPATAGLREAVASSALQQPEVVEQWLSAHGTTQRWFVAPQLAQGRLGYPLSGRGMWKWFKPRSLLDRAREIYPGFDDSQRRQWLQTLIGTPEQVEQALAQLKRELGSLRRQLNAWADEPTSRSDASARRAFKDALVDLWQRRTGLQPDTSLLQAEYSWAPGRIRLQQLPELPAQVRFGHVTALAFNDMQLEEVPNSFFKAFPRLRRLRMSGNRLTRIPQALGELQQLKVLDLSRNRIALDPVQYRTLQRCAQLEYLNLGHNPLGLTFSVSSMTGLVELHLRYARIRQLPYGVMGCEHLRQLDLFDSAIREMPDGFFASRVWLQGNVQFSPNQLVASDRALAQRALSAPGSSAAAAQWRWLDHLDDTLRATFETTWNALQQRRGSELFFEWLRRLLDTAEFHTPKGARLLASRVHDLLQTMQANPALAEELFIYAGEMSCTDSVTQRMADMEVRVLVWEAEHAPVQEGSESRLLDLGRRLWRLDKVREIARRDMDAGVVGDDQVEVVLAYEVGLRRRLHLPTRTTDTRYTDRKVDEARLALTCQRVLADESEQALARSLVAHEFWSGYLKKHHRDAFKALLAPFRARLEWIERQTEEGEDTTGQFAQLADEQANAERERLMQYTLEALRRRYP